MQENCVFRAKLTRDAELLRKLFCLDIGSSCTCVIHTIPPMKSLIWSPTTNLIAISSSSNFVELIKLSRNCQSPCPQFGRCSDICVWLLRISKHSSLHSYHFTPSKSKCFQSKLFTNFQLYLSFLFDDFYSKMSWLMTTVVCRYSFIWTTYI